MLYNGRLVMDIHVGKRMRTALIAQQQGVALAIVAGIVRFLGNAHQTAVRFSLRPAEIPLLTIVLRVFFPR